MKRDECGAQQKKAEGADSEERWNFPTFLQVQRTAKSPGLGVKEEEEAAIKRVF